MQVKQPVPLLSLLLLSIYFICIALSGDCSYFYDETSDLSFPTNKCINSTQSITNKKSSMSYICKSGLLSTKIYQYIYPKLNCKGSPSQTYLGWCSSPECNCDSTDSGSFCTIKTFEYDDDYKQNITIITDTCINGNIFIQSNHNLYKQQYDNNDCNGQIYKNTKINLFSSSSSTTSTTFIPLLSSSTTTSSSTTSSTLIIKQYKGLFIICIICIMVIGTLCSICCMMRKYRKNGKRKQKRKLIENDGELNKEGIKNEQFQDEIEEIEIAEKVNIDDYSDDNDDIPAPAYSYSHDVVDNNNNDDEGIIDDNNDDDESD